MFKGSMEVLEDAERKVMIRQSGDEQYYALGATDPITVF